MMKVSCIKVLMPIGCYFPWPVQGGDVSILGTTDISNGRSEFTLPLCWLACFLDNRNIDMRQGIEREDKEKGIDEWKRGADQARWRRMVRVVPLLLCDVVRCPSAQFSRHPDPLLIMSGLTLHSASGRLD